jgi:gliding motility-associated-like protein
MFVGNGINGNNFTGADAGSGNHTITYTYTDANNCTNYTTQNVSVHLVPVATATVRDISCFGVNDGSITLQITDCAAPFDFNWNNYAYTNQNLASLSQGSYVLLLTDAQGCTFTASYNIAEPAVLTSSFETTDAICFGDVNGSAVFSVNGGTQPYQFSWSNNFSSEANYSLTAGEYFVTITDANGCFNFHYFTITQPQQVWINATPPVDSVFYGNSVQITTEHFANDLFVTYTWEPTTALNCGHCANPLATPDETIQYIVTMTDETGCTASTQVLVIVKQEHVYYVPNIFSPNGDGINDVFQIFVKAVREFHLQIHDRWGELVFQSAHPNAVWNGTFNGRELPNGVYVYDVYVVYKDGELFKKKGSVTLVR